ncbi:MAG TPA: hypothetical protein VH583_02085 [Vicinamibacterales bacterium]
MTETTTSVPNECSYNKPNVMRPASQAAPKQLSKTRRPSSVGPR